MVKKILKISAIFIIGIGGGIFGSQFLSPYFFKKSISSQNLFPPQTPIQVIEKKEIIQENVALKKAIEKVEKTVIAVRTETKKGKFIEGSGFILTSDGLIVTLAELVPREGKFSFFIDEEAVPYQILKRNLKENLALVKVEKENLPTISFGDLEKLKLGERVFLVGKVFKTKGIKTLVNEGIVKYFDRDFIETNIFEEKNLAGSVLFDIEGNVLGINIVDEKGKVTALSVSKIRSFTGF